MRPSRYGAAPKPDNAKTKGPEAVGFANGPMPSEGCEHVNKPKRSGRAGLAIGGLLAAIAAGGFLAEFPDNDRNALGPEPVTKNILPTYLQAPQLPSSEATKPAGTKSPEVTYLRITPPSDVPILGEEFCINTPLDSAETTKASNGSHFVRVDGRCMGGDPTKSNTAEVLVYQNPNDIRSSNFTVPTGALANLLCVEAGPRTSDSNNSNSETWVRADFYSNNGVYKDRGSVPSAVVGFAPDNPRLGPDLPACGQVARRYFP